MGLGGFVAGVVGLSMGSLCLRVWWGLSSGLGGCCQVVFEASGVDEAADGVVREVAQIPGRCRVGAPGAR